MEDPRIASLQGAVDADPGNAGLRLALATTMADLGELAAACTQFNLLMEAEALPTGQFGSVARLALMAGNLALAGRCVERGPAAGVSPTELEDIRRDLSAALRDASDASIPSAEELSELHDVVDGLPATGIDYRDRQPINFEHVAGLADVKKAINRAIILPFQKPELYAKYGRTAGGGSMLYGPPGCGKTMLARATAGECGLPFINVRIEEILSAYRGESEKQLHQLFETARQMAPCVLFIDELDALAYTRVRQTSDMGRTLVNVLLTELDSIGAENTGMLILGATNAPWDVDDALKRPGRFDHFTFVPPPDEKARRFLLEAQLAGRPSDGVNLGTIAAATGMYSGADLVALIERSVDVAIDDALEAGREVPITHAHVVDALSRTRATTVEWLLAARNHAEFANQGGQYDDLAKYLTSRDVRKLLAKR